MALGDAISKTPIAGVIGTGLSIYDFINSRKTLNLADAEYQQMRELLQQSLMRDADRYNDVAGRAGELDATLRAAFTALGPRSAITPEQIAARQQQLQRLYLDDINQQTGVTASQNYAMARTNGMVDSTLMRDNEARIAAASALAANKARAQSFNDAASQLQTEDNIVNKNREAILGEYENVLTSPVDLLYGKGGSSTQDLNSALGNFANVVSAASQNAGAFTKDATETIKGIFGNKTLADMWG
jgi:hypothetical protein